jgi:fatty-acyl-CoA synthase
VTDRPANREELTPVSFLERAGVVHADRTAVVDGATSYTWAEFRDRSRRLGSALRRSGLRRGDRVAVLALNSEPLLLAHFGIPQGGGVIVAINTRLSADEVAYIIEHSGSTTVIVAPELHSLLEKVPPSVRQVVIGPGLESFLATGSDQDAGLMPDSENDLIAIDYTSGTTGTPKGVMYQHRAAYLNALAMVIENRLTTESRFLWTLPMFHCNGWSHTWAMAAAGSTSLCLPMIDVAEIWRSLAEEQVSHLNAAPTVLIMLANDPLAHRLPHPVRVCTGGAPPSPTLIDQMKSFNIDLIHLYGLTETYGPTAISVPPPGFERWNDADKASYQARQGFPHVAVGSIAVVDDSMNQLPGDGQSLGEVVVRGNTVMAGYFGEPDATAEAFHGGWFHTGDLGVMHLDGSLELRDRKKDIVISGGENISTIEVEQAVMSHAAVLEAAVIAVPDPKWGEVPKAFVVLRPGVSVTPEELIEHVRERLAHYKAPRLIEFGELPKTSTGKVQKHVLRERERERLAAGAVRSPDAGRSHDG